jgi:hypothetical protein
MASDEMGRGEKLMLYIGAIISVIILLGPLIFAIGFLMIPGD